MRGLLLLGLPALMFAQVQSTAAVAKVTSSPAQTLSLVSLRMTPGINSPMGVSRGGNPFISGEAGAILLPGPWHVSVEASYHYYFCLYRGLSASIGLSCDLAPSSATTPMKVQEPPPVKAQTLSEQPPTEKPLQKAAAPLEIKELSFDDVYPEFHTYYDTHPLGESVPHNTSGQSIRNIRVGFQIKDFMADPKDCPASSELEPGESKSVDLFGLFLPTILQTKEKTKTQARVDVEYMLGGQVQHQSLVQSVLILDRNAITWADDRRAAAFVTTKDPAVLTANKQVAEE